MDERELLVLKTIYFEPNPTRMRISELTHMSTVLVSNILRNLEKSGHIRKEGKTKTSGGRPSILYSIDPDIGVFLGISVRTDSFTISVLNTTGEIIKTLDYGLTLSSQPEEHVDNIVSRVSSETERLIQQLKSKYKPLALGISVPGMVDTENGIWQHGLQLTGITGVNLRDILQNRLNIPGYIEDQSRASTLYEMRRGEGRDVQNWVLLYLGNGIGTGIVIRGELYRGHRGISGEIGHLVVNKEGIRCSCGNIGCFETILSVPGILRHFRQRLDEGVMSSLQKYHQNDSDNLSLEKIRNAATERDKLTLSTLFDIGLFLGDACIKLIKILSPEKTIISGPASILGDYFKNPMDITFTRQVMPEMLAGKTVMFAEYEYHHTAWGAAFGAMDSFWENVRIEDLSAAGRNRLLRKPGS